MVTWWYRISANPSMENICLAMNGVVYSTSETKEGSITDEEKFKKKVVRYCLLSWTMCLSNFSEVVKDHFFDKKVKIIAHNVILLNFSRAGNENFFGLIVSSTFYRNT